MLKFSPEDMARLAQIVREETGNSVQEKNFSMLESRMRTHLMKADIENMTDYWQYYKANEKQEREILKGLMTTHYTFFFREYAHFDALEKWIESEAPRLKVRYASQKTPVRVWSAACSRGHEVYSLAMFLDINLSKRHNVPFEIVGTDIDKESVAYGANGVYPIKEVNVIPQMYLSRFWKRGTGKIKEYAAVQGDLKARTRFETINLLELKKWKEDKAFDVIFCSNVFIYFSAENVKNIALDLSSRLNESGLLVSGMSEPLRFNEWTLPSVGPSCYQKKGAVPKVESISKSTSVTGKVPSPPVPHVAVVSEKSSSKYRVLCVDDSGTIQKLMKKIFSDDPLCEKVDIAENGLIAHQKLKAEKYDLITLDIHMPEVNGIEFLEKFYNRKNDPPVIMVSSVNRTDIDLATKSLSLGAFDYVEKPAMNNLQKSAEEILTKAKMALRSRQKSDDSSTGGFDASIGQKIVVPDASLCLRVILATPSSVNLLKQVIKGQAGEYRSPANLILWRDDQKSMSIENQLVDWTERQVETLRDVKPHLKPNVIYIAQSQQAGYILKSLKVKNISLQVLDASVVSKDLSIPNVNVQMLVDETQQEHVAQIQIKMGIRASDVSPATSFPSLSVEFFANLRASAA